MNHAQRDFVTLALVWVMLAMVALSGCALGNDDRWQRLFWERHERLMP